MIKIKFPDGVNIFEHLSETLGILSLMEEKFKTDKKISLDFSEVTWFIPCSMILISNKIREFLEHGAHVIEYKAPKNDKARDHMNKIGFPLGKTESGDSYVPIKHFKRNIDDKKQVNREVNELTTLIEEKLPSQFGDSIKYILGELSANIDDHSECESVSLMAQYFPTKEIVDIAVFDNGISIPALFERHNISFENDAEAIKKAVSGEVTTKENETMRGFGLKTCKNLSIEGLEGELHVVSRKGILIMKSGESPKFHTLKKTLLKGTFLYFRLKKPKNKLNIYKFIE
jgi:hypothetical protein